MKYEININGDIYGRITFMGVLNGKEVSDNYRVSLELKPIITDIQITDVINEPETHSYDVHYTVYYCGADRILVSVEEEYGARMPIWVFNEPFRVSGVADKIASLHHAWLDFIAENKYGRTMETVVFGPNGSIIESSLEKRLYSRYDNADAWNYDYVKIYDIFGNLLSVEPKGVSINNLSKGLYVLKFYDQNDICTKTCKYIRR